MSNLLEIKDLQVHFRSGGQLVRAVDGISLDLAPGETLGIVGESGSGKTATALAVMRLLPPAANVAGGQIFFQKNEAATDLLALPEAQMRPLRGGPLAMIFQEPMSSLNPVFRCGPQVAEAIRLHQNLPKNEANALTIKLFEKTRLPDPARIFRSFPHQLSGGQLQRVMLALALANAPQLLIADEPTTALDVTVQKQILDLLAELRAETGLSMLFISHDLGVVRHVADRVAVMRQGKIVETGPVREVLENPQHVYTQGLVACRPARWLGVSERPGRLPTLGEPVPTGENVGRVNNPSDVVLEVKNLTVRFPARKNWLGQATEWLNAVDSIDFQVLKGEIFGLVGESGSGKTTLGKAIARLADAHAGQVFFQNQNLLGLPDEAFAPLRRQIQFVFQNPEASLDPRQSIGEAILEPLTVHARHLPGCETAASRRARALQLLDNVQLTHDLFDRRPAELSGGQRQRAALARALAVQPTLLICDEITSALDVSVQATVLNLLLDLRERFGLTLLLISHDLGVVNFVCDRVLVLNQGKIEQIGTPREVFEKPATEYVRHLVEAVL